MSRQRTRIVNALRAKGYTPTRIEWEAIGAGAEKAGPSGGWWVQFSPPAPVPWMPGGETLVLGYNVAEVLADIAQLSERDGLEPA